MGTGKAAVKRPAAKGRAPVKRPAAKGKARPSGEPKFPKCRKAYLTQLRAEWLVALWAEAEGVKWKRPTGSLDPVPGVPQEELAGGWEEEEPVVHPKGRPGRPGAPALRDRAAAGGWSSACSPVPVKWPTTSEVKASTKKPARKVQKAPAAAHPTAKNATPTTPEPSAFESCFKALCAGLQKRWATFVAEAENHLLVHPPLKFAFHPDVCRELWFLNPNAGLVEVAGRPFASYGPLPRLPRNAATRESGLTD